MNPPTPKNVVRCTLQSYIGTEIKDIEMGARQREAVHRLCQLREEKFEELCCDTVNEIHRRSGMKHDMNNKMYRKFLKLSDQKFRNLVADVLTVFYLKNPDYKMEDVPEFLESLKDVITQLKMDSEKSTFLEKVEKLDFYNKILEYIEYTRKSGTDERITTHMANAVEEKISADVINFFEFLSFPKIFLEKMREMKIFKRIGCKRLDVCRECILKAFSDSSIGAKTRSEVVKQNLIEIMTMLINGSKIPALQIECFDQEITVLINLLDSLRADLEKGNEVDLNLVGARLSEMVETVASKAELEVGREVVSEVKLQRISLESLGELSSKMESFQLIIDVIKDMRKFFGTMET